MMPVQGVAPEVAPEVAAAVEGAEEEFSEVAGAECLEAEQGAACSEVEEAEEEAVLGFVRQRPVR